MTSSSLLNAPSPSLGGTVTSGGSLSPAHHKEPSPMSSASRTGMGNYENVSIGGISGEGKDAKAKESKEDKEGSEIVKPQPTQVHKQSSCQKRFGSSVF